MKSRAFGLVLVTFIILSATYPQRAAAWGEIHRIAPTKGYTSAGCNQYTTPPFAPSLQAAFECVAQVIASHPEWTCPGPGSVTLTGSIIQQNDWIWGFQTIEYPWGCSNPPVTLDYNITAMLQLTCPAEYQYEAASTGEYAPYGSCWIRMVKRDKSTKPCNDPQLCQGNPIYPATGNKRQIETDYSGAGAPELKFARIYNSDPNFAGSAAHSLDYRIVYSNWNGTIAPTARLVRPEGNYTFEWTGSAWVTDADVNLKLAGTDLYFVVTNADGTRIENYDTNDRLSTVTTVTGTTLLTLSYDSSYWPIIRLTGATDSFGHSLSFGYDSQHRITSMTNPGGGVTQYSYDSNNNLTQVTYPDTTTRTYVFNESAYTSSTSQLRALTGIVDEASVRFANFGYNATGHAVLSEHAGGAGRVTVTYSTLPSVVETKTFDTSQHVMSLTTENSVPASVVTADAFNTSHTLNFQKVQGMPKAAGGSGVCAHCGITSSAKNHDSNGNVTSTKDFNNRLSCFEYDTSRNLETVRVEGFASSVTSCPSSLASYTPAGGTRERKIVTAWHSTFRRPTSITEANRTTTFTHDSNGNVLTRTVTDTSVTPNVSRTWTYTYNSFGRVLTENGPRTDVTDQTTYTYYSCSTGSQCGHLNTITNAAGHVTTYNSYNAHGQPTQITDANGLITTLAYDARQRLTDRCVGSTLPSCTSGELTHLDYWTTGLLKKVTSPDGSYLQYTYDDAHRLTQIQDGASNKITYTLDAMGNRTAENTYDSSNSLKRTHSRVYNSLNQFWKDVNAAGTPAVTTVFGYDSQGNQTTTNAPLTRNSTNSYDELNRLNQITDPNSGNTVFVYDANDNLTSVTDPRTLVTSYTYTGFGDLKTQVSPDTGTTTNTYDSGGNLATSTDARAAITTYTYDALNRVTSAAFKIGSTTDQTIAFTYDGGTNQKGQLTSASDANHSMAWTYDSKGRVTSKAQVVGTFNKAVGYGYNAQGQLASIVLPSGKTIQYGYNSNNQVTSVTLLGSPNVTILNNITYDPFGPVTGWTWGNGSTATRVFDADGKLTSTSSSVTAVGNRTFGFDNAFRITSTTDSATGGPSWTVGYDILDRLNSATKTGTTIGYTYDSNGNRLTQTGTSASTYTVSGSSNKLSSTSGALVRTYTYNNSGSVLTSGATTHTYYNSGRMKTAKLGAAAVTTYIYNALGQRVKKSGGGATTTLFMYDEAGHLVGEYLDSSNALVQETVWLGDIPVATLRPNGSNVDVFYVHTDQLNAPRKITTSASTPALKWKWDPTPFGEGAPTEPAGTFKYNLRLPGQYFDSESNLNYNYFRDFDPAIGRYVESDPIGLSGGINTFGYVGSNPLASIDPLGLMGYGGGGGPWHPKNNAPMRCTSKDECPTLRAKMWVFMRMLTSHQGWDRYAPSGRGQTVHQAEIAALWLAYGRCLTLYNNKNCRGCIPTEKEPEWVPLPPNLVLDPDDGSPARYSASGDSTTTLGAAALAFGAAVLFIFAW